MGEMHVSRTKSIFMLTPKKCLVFMLKYCIVMVFLHTMFQLPTSIYYLCDLLCLLLLCYVIKHNGEILRQKEFKGIVIIFVMFLICNFISVLLNTVSIPLVAWGARNTFRYFIVFFSVLIYFNEQDCDKIMNFYFKIQIINMFVGIYKYFVLHLFSDAFGGGLFSSGGELNPFCLLLLSYYSNILFYKKEKFGRFIMVFISSFILAAMGEEKFLIFMIIVVVILSYLISLTRQKGLSVRKFVLSITIISGIVIGVNAINILAPDALNIITSYDNFIEYGSVSYSEGYRIPRIGAFSVINELFLHTSFQRYLGLGMGNCDTSSFSWLQSDFYKSYGEYNYRWFTHQWTYLECGKLGFGLYILFFVVIIITIIRNIKKVSKESEAIMFSSSIFTISMITMMWHSSAMKIDTAYVIYFGIAMGLIPIKNRRSKFSISK